MALMKPLSREMRINQIEFCAVAWIGMQNLYLALGTVESTEFVRESLSARLIVVSV